MLFFLDNLQIYQMSVSLQRVFHSIRSVSYTHLTLPTILRV